MKIKVILPSVADFDLKQVAEDMQVYFSPDVQFDVEKLDHGTDSIECELDVVLAGPDILRKVQAAEKDGYDGVFISCFDDPAVSAAREIVDIPVVGAFEPSMLLAMGLGDRICIVTVLAEGLSATEKKIKQMAIADRMTPVRYVDIPVLELEDRQRMLEELTKESLLGIEQDRAQVIVLGCTGMTNVYKKLQENLRSAGYDIPVIEPAFAAIQLLESYIKMGVRQSRLMYYPPRAKNRIW